MEKICKIWCDGSYRQAHRTSGAGWVIAHPDGQIETMALPLPQLKNSFNHGSYIAELSAAATAMGALPKGSSAIIHMDCKAVISALTNRSLPRPEYERMPSLRAAFSRALKAFDRLDRVEIILAHDDTDPHMSLAHRLSRDASRHPNT